MSIADVSFSIHSSASATIKRLIQGLNDINHHGNFKGKSRVTHCENSKSRMRPLLLWPRFLKRSTFNVTLVSQITFYMTS